MPRKSRKLSPTDVYHVVIRGIDRQLLFEEDKDYQKYLQILEYYKKECDYHLYAYCLMSNHVHLLIHIGSTPLSSVFEKINTRYAVWFNMKYQRTGPLQQGRFYSEPVLDTSYLLNVLCYIHCNPLKAGLENECGLSYPWSSFHQYISSNSTLVDTEFILNILGNLTSFYDLHHAYCYRDAACLDVDNMKHRLPDDVARDIIADVCNCHTVTDFQNLSLSQREEYILLLKKKGISIRQLNRLTGIPRGVIERTVAKGHPS